MDFIIIVSGEFFSLASSVLCVLNETNSAARGANFVGYGPLISCVFYHVLCADKSPGPLKLAGCCRRIVVTIDRGVSPSLGTSVAHH